MIVNQKYVLFQMIFNLKKLKIYFKKIKVISIENFNEKIESFEKIFLEKLKYKKLFSENKIRL